MQNIYSIEAWSTSRTYAKHEIVDSNGFFQYSLQDGNVGNATASAGSPINSWWGGIRRDTNSEVKPHFHWVPSYSSEVQMAPRIKKIQYGDGYTQTMPDGVSTNLLTLNLSFDLRNLLEITAINQFLHARLGTESFLFVPSPPFHKLKRFRCENWNTVPSFYDNYNLRCTFNEVAI